MIEKTKFAANSNENVAENYKMVVGCDFVQTSSDETPLQSLESKTFNEILSTVEILQYRFFYNFA